MHDRWKRYILARPVYGYQNDSENSRLAYARPSLNECYSADLNALQCFLL